MNSMKALVKTRPEPEALEMKSVPIPDLGPSDVMIRTRAVSICGTDLHIYNWDAWSQQRVKTPRILGHEFAGEVVEIGGHVEHVQVGDYVTGEGHLVCGFCERCRTGEGHVCRDWKGIGYDVDGAFAEYVVIPERNVWHNDEGLDPAHAAIQDPLGNAVHAVFQTDCTTKSVAVFGCGPVGLLAISVLKTIGASQIFAVEWDNAYRSRLAMEVGAHHVIHAKNQDPTEYIRQQTGGYGVDVAIEISGSPKALNDALDSVHPAGHVVLMGLPSQKVPLDISEKIVFRSLRLYGVTGRKIWDTWMRMAGLFRSRALNVDPIITHRFPFDDYLEGFELMRTGQCGKVVLDL